MELLVPLLLMVPFLFSMLAARDARRREHASGGVQICADAATELGLTARGERFVRRHQEQLELELSGLPEGHQIGRRITARVRLMRPTATELRVGPNRGDRPTEIPIGYDFDQRFRVSSPRPERAARLLRGRLGNALVTADSLGFAVELDNTQVTVVGRWITRIDEVQSICRTGEELARQLIAAEGSLPRLLPWQKLATAWRAAAERLDARFDAEAHAIDKQTSIGRLWLHAGTLREERWFAELELQLDRPLPARFELTNEAARTLWERLTVKDIQLGDPAFDQTFFIATDQPQAVRELLDAEARGALVELERRAGTISIGTHAIRGRLEGAAVIDPALLAGVAESAIAAAEALVRAASPGGRGAYR
jgi:hypothetical protein